MEGPMKIIFFLVAGLFAFLFLIFVYYLYNEKLVDNQYQGEPHNSEYNLDRLAPESSSVSSSKNNLGDKMPLDNIVETPKETVAPVKQVFNISENKYTYKEGEALCKVFDSELATLDQLIDAYKKGADWCNYGWVQGQMAFYPTQKTTWDKLQKNSTPDKRNACGKPGLNGGFFNNPELRFGVNCYGIKNQPRGNERIKQPLISDADAELQQMIDKFRKEVDNITILAFSHDKWSLC
jgi:hypothetical protein